MIDDSTLQAMVMEELDWDPSLNAAHIGVTAKNGVVTLSGFVDNYAAKVSAERIASRIRGVQAIAQEIEVRLPNAHKSADDEIAERAVRILTWDVSVPHERIQVKVERGLVTLAGDVSSHFERSEAETDVRRLSGVRGVTNLIRVVPTVNPSPDPEVVEQRIENALCRNAEIEASRIDVKVAGGTITLRGQVHTWFESSAAENAAWAAPGVSEVKNELRVQS